MQKVLQDAADHRGILPLFWFCVLCLLGLYHFRVVIMVDSVSYLAKQNPVILQSLESPELRSALSCLEKCSKTMQQRQGLQHVLSASQSYSKGRELK